MPEIIEPKPVDPKQDMKSLLTHMRGDVVEPKEEESNDTKPGILEDTKEVKPVEDKKTEKSTEDSSGGNTTEPKSEKTTPTSETVNPEDEIFNMLNSLLGGTTEEPKVEEPKSTEEKKEEKKETPKKETSTLSDDDFSELLESKEKFDSYLQKRDQQVAQSVMSQVNQYIGPVINQTVQNYLAAQEFWTRNKDLKPIQAVVAKKATEIASKNPNMTTADVFKETEKEIREVLRVLRKEEKTEDVVTKSETKIPKFATTGNPKPIGDVNTGGDKLSPAQKDMASLLNFIHQE